MRHFGDEPGNLSAKRTKLMRALYRGIRRLRLDAIIAENCIQTV